MSREEKLSREEYDELERIKYKVKSHFVCRCRSYGVRKLICVFFQEKREARKEMRGEKIPIKYLHAQKEKIAFKAIDQVINNLQAQKNLKKVQSLLYYLFPVLTLILTLKMATGPLALQLLPRK
jgi:hypothetical protein